MSRKKIPDFTAVGKTADDACCSSCAAPALSMPAEESTERQREKWHIPNMDCPVEEKAIREILSGIPGIRQLTFNLSARTLTIEAAQATRRLAGEAIRKAGFPPKTVESPFDAAHGNDEDHDHANPGYLRLGIALFLALAVELFDFFLPETSLVKGLEIALAVTAIALSGFDVYLNGWRSIMARRLNINALMSVAVTGAVILGHWGEAAMVMVLFAIAELIEGRAVDKARNAIQQLFSLAPETAEVRQADGSWQTVATGAIEPEQTVRVKAGERIPLDGTISAGFSAVNQMAITGESIPVEKTAGDAVYAGSINESGVIEFTVTARADETMLARIITAVEQAQENRAPTQRFVDRFAVVYTPAVFFIAVAIAVITPLVTSLSWWEATYRALVLLVISCPCALVISTPVTVVSGLAAAARNGILIKGGVYLEEARRIRTIALDKTGTLTLGEPVLVDVQVSGSTAEKAAALEWAYAVASVSSHPVSAAIARGLDEAELEPLRITEVPGKGIQADINGSTVRLGNARWMAESGIDLSGWQDKIEVHEREGHSVSLLATNSAVLGLFAVADTLRSTSVEAITYMRSHQLMPVMLTGDNALTAAAIGHEAGVSDIFSDLLPEDKQAAVQQLQRERGHVGMIGDGINDAPALVTANIGIAMGGVGTDIAMETADVVIMNDDLRKVVDLVDLSGSTFNVLRQNIIIALGIKLVFFGLALAGLASLWMAVFADVGSTLIVVFNGLRLLRWKSDHFVHALNTPGQAHP